MGHGAFLLSATAGMGETAGMGGAGEGKEVVFSAVD